MEAGDTYGKANVLILVLLELSLWVELVLLLVMKLLVS